jgi:hypothetical protein
VTPGDLKAIDVAIQRKARETSRIARLRLLPNVTAQLRDVLDFYYRRQQRGATHEEVRRVLHISYSASTTRSQDLEKSGWIMDSGRERDTTRGNPAMVWVITEKGNREIKAERGE